MRSRLRPSALICLTVCFVVLVLSVTAVRTVDRVADLLRSCMDGEAPVTTVHAGEQPPGNGCWTSTQPMSSSESFGPAR